MDLRFIRGQPFGALAHACQAAEVQLADDELARIALELLAIWSDGEEKSKNENDPM